MDCGFGRVVHMLQIGVVVSQGWCILSNMSSDTATVPPADLPVDPGDTTSWSDGGFDELTAATLAQLPALGQALAAARAVDRQVALLLDGLLVLVEHDAAETVTGVPLEQWLAIVGRRTSSDRRMLLTAVDALRRLPSLRQAFCDDASVSWAQVRAIALRVQRSPRRADDLIDAELARTIAVCRHDEPDTLLHAISRALTGLDDQPSTPTEPARPPAEEFLAIQPRLDGTGGQLYGQLGPVSLATVDAALTPPPEALTEPGRGAAARTRAARLVALCDQALDGASSPEHDFQTGGATDRTPDPSDVGQAGSDSDRAGADRQLAGGSSDRAGSRPQLLIRVPLATLLDHDQLPGELLTRLTGGKLWADATTIRQLVQERGADLRTIVLDDTGSVVGIGRRGRIAPGWLTDATLALHDTCSFPSCERPARSCDTDHARPWWPTRPATWQPPPDTSRPDLAREQPAPYNPNRSPPTRTGRAPPTRTDPRGDLTLLSWPRDPGYDLSLGAQVSEQVRSTLRATALPHPCGAPFVVDRAFAPSSQDAWTSSRSRPSTRSPP